MRESSVNFQSLIRDLAEMYPFEVDEVVVTELVANSLDAGATRICIDYDALRGILVVEDNGKGMTEREFIGYHDFAAELKTRGTGIGFAGVGAKVSFRIAHRVITETRSESLEAGSDWYLDASGRLVWEEIKPKYLAGTGTRVEIHLRQAENRSFETSEDLVRLLRRHYLPLFDWNFLELYHSLGIYHRDLRFVINGCQVQPVDLASELNLSHLREFYPTINRRRYGYGILGLSNRDYPLAPDLCGMLVCTYGKVVKAELFNQFPGELGSKIFGLVEVPALVQFLTTTKTDFSRQGRHRQFEELYDPLRHEFKLWLAELGVRQIETSGGSESTKLEREIKKILEDVPELGEFFGLKSQRTLFAEDGSGSLKEVEAANRLAGAHSDGSDLKPGGQAAPLQSVLQSTCEPAEGSASLPREGIPGDASGSEITAQDSQIDQDDQTAGASATRSDLPRSSASEAAATQTTDSPAFPRIELSPPENTRTTRASPISRPARRGPRISFMNVPDRAEMAWVEGNTVVVNTGHPAYIKVRSNSNARMLHNLFAIGSAIQRYLAAEGQTDLTFVDRMMRAWGSR